MQSGSYIVVGTNKATGHSSMSEKPKTHATEAAAKQEAARLAQANPEREFTVLRVVITASVEKVSWS